MSLVNFGLFFMRERIFEEKIRAWSSGITSPVASAMVGNIWRSNRWMMAQRTSYLLMKTFSFRWKSVHIMAERRQPLVCANYKIRYEGAPFAAISPDFETRIATTADSPDVEPCGACGFGLALIAREVFEALPHPWFPIHWSDESQTYSTEDVPFFLEARKAGFTPLIDHVASRGVAHIGSFRYRWDGPALNP
jgi:hypothetical protein